MATPGRMRTAGVTVAVVLAAVAVGALAATGRLGLTPAPTTAPVVQASAVQCYDVDGDLSSGWSAGAGGVPAGARVDPVAICDALYQDHAAVAEMDRIATQQQARGRDCVMFDSTDGGRWFLTGLVSSPGGSYSASGGPPPGRLPGFGQPAAPAPLAGLAPRPNTTIGCVELPTVTWNTAVPAMAACTRDHFTVSVFVQPAGKTAAAVCATKRLSVATR